MVKTNNGGLPSGAGAPAKGGGGLQKRMESLLQRRTDAAAPVVPENAPAEKVRGRFEGAEGEAHRKALARIYRVLTDTPADATGTVPGTPFTQAGVLRLIETLKQRSANVGAPGARVAAGLLKMLSATAEEPGAVHGISIEKLQRLSKTAGNLKAKGFGRR